LTNWFPDHAILEPKQGGKMKFSFYKEKSQKDHTCTADAFPEGTIKEFIPNKKLSYTLATQGCTRIPRDDSKLGTGRDRYQQNKSRTDSFRLYRKRRA